MTSNKTTFFFNFVRKFSTEIRQRGGFIMQQKGKNRRESFRSYVGSSDDVTSVYNSYMLGLVVLGTYLPSGTVKIP